MLGASILPINKQTRTYNYKGVQLPLACRAARRPRHVAPIEGRDRLYISTHSQVPPEQVFIKLNNTSRIQLDRVLT